MGRLLRSDYAASPSLGSAAEPAKEWTRLLGGTGYEFGSALTEGVDGAVYFAGTTDGTLDGQRNSGVDAFITKYDASGAKAWTRLLGSTSFEYGNALTTGLDGSIYLAGMTGSSTYWDGNLARGGDDAFVTKYNANGTKAWTRVLGGTANDIGQALTTGLDGAVYMAGYTFGAIDGRGNSGGIDAFLAKYDANGNKAWTRLLGGSSLDYGQALTTGLDGTIYMAGKTFSSTLDGQSSSGLDAFIAKYDADGTKVWTRLLGGGGGSGFTSGEALTTGLDGAIYLAGYTTQTTLDGQLSNGGRDAFITKFDTNGSKVWTRLLGGSGDEVCYAIRTGLDGAIYLTGTSAITIIDGQTINGTQDIFITKFDANGTKAWTRLFGGGG